MEHLLFGSNPGISTVASVSHSRSQCQEGEITGGDPGLLNGRRNLQSFKDFGEAGGNHRSLCLE